MVTYIVTMPSEEDTESRRYKCVPASALVAGGTAPSPPAGTGALALTLTLTLTRYPYVASEVLSCDLSAMQDILLSVSSGLVEQVLAILQQPPPLAPVLAGYCSKVIVGLFKSVPEQFSQFFTDHWAAQPDSLIRCGSSGLGRVSGGWAVSEPPGRADAESGREPGAGGRWQGAGAGGGGRVVGGGRVQGAFGLVAHTLVPVASQHAEAPAPSAAARGV